MTKDRRSRKSRRSKSNSKYNAFQLIVKTVRYCDKYRRILVACFLTCAISVAAGIVVPLFSSQIILRITDGAIEQVIYTALAMLAVNLLDSAVTLVHIHLFHSLQYGTLYGLQQALVRETLRMQVSEIDKNGTGKIIERLANDADKVSSTFSDYAYWLTYLISNVGILITVLILSREMFIISVIIAVVCFVASNERIKRIAEVRKSFNTSRDERTGMATEIIRGIRDIKTLNASEAIARKVGRKIRETAEHERSIHTIDRKFQAVEMAAYYVSEFAFLAFGCFLYAQGRLTIPVFIIVYNYLNDIRNLFYGAARIIEDNKTISLSGDRLFEIIDDDTYRKERFGLTEKSRLDGNIEFHHVSFSYGKKPVIKDLNMSISANEKVSIVGKSGSGKTTIMSLIPRLYDCNSGEILIDGIPIQDYTCDSLRNNISVVTQQPYIFNYSVKENLRLAKPNAKMSEIREACRTARIDDYIMSLPNKYNTKLGEGGVILSGGQKQRLAIARALLMKTKIILFDEATSALDNKTQSDIQEAIAELKGDYTIIIVAHRLSTIIDSDRIFVIEEGTLIDSGTHRELLRRCSLYKNLYNKGSGRTAS